MKLNLYLFNATDSAATYGIGTYLRELPQTLTGTDMKVHIVHLHSVRPEFEIVKTNQVENWFVPEVRGENTFSGEIQKLENYYRNVIYLLRLYIKDTEGLVFHFNFNHSYYLAKGLKSVFDCQTVCTVHLIKWALELQGNLTHLRALKVKSEDQRSPYEQILLDTDEYERMLYEEVDRVIALSHYTVNILLTEYHLDREKISVIPNGLADVDFQTLGSKDLLRKKRHVSEKELLILFVGRLHTVKGLMYLLMAFRKVLEVIPDCRLIIAGNGTFERYMSVCADICTHVTWTGLLDKNNLSEFYSIADIGVMPSLHEQCSYVAIEMMRHSLPIIGSTSTGLKEMIDEGETGLHIPVTEHENRVEIDMSLLADKMLFLLQNPIERQRMGQNARKRYEEYYSKEKFRENMLHFYHSRCM